MDVVFFVSKAYKEDCIWKTIWNINEKSTWKPKKVKSDKWKLNFIDKMADLISIKRLFTSFFLKLSRFILNRPKFKILLI